MSGRGEVGIMTSGYRNDPGHDLNRCNEVVSAWALHGWVVGNGGGIIGGADRWWYVWVCEWGWGWGQGAGVGVRVGLHACVCLLSCC